MTDAWGERISTAEDFPHVAIYEGPGPVYALSFWNREWPTDAGYFGKFVVWALVNAAGFYLVFALPRPVQETVGIPWYVTAAAVVGVMAYAFYWAMNPGWARRLIVMDYARDRVQVLRNGRRKLDRTLSQLKNITIADHPDAELERARRGAGKGPGPLQKQHCLLGWFGAGDTGSDQVILVSRFEFPKLQTLFEVGQAMIWVRRRAAGGPAAPTMQSAPAGDDEPTSIKPPLD